MRKLAALTFISLDGVMQAPSHPEEDGSNNFRQGGWATPYWEEVMEQVATEAMAEPYDLLLGRKTYEMFADHLSKSDDQEGESSKLNSAKKYVVTNSLENLGWNNSVPVSGDLVNGISQLKAQKGPLLQVHGSWQLLQGLFNLGLVDELRLWTFPVVIGVGKRLFEQGLEPTEFELVKTGSTKNGVVMSIHRRMNN